MRHFIVRLLGQVTMRFYRRLQSGVTIASIALSVGCAGQDSIGTMPQLQEIQGQVREFIGANTVSVNLIEQHILDIRIVNSLWNDKLLADQRQEAKKIAQIALRHYREGTELRRIRIVFVVQRTRFLVVREIDNRQSFEFDISELSSP